MKASGAKIIPGPEHRVLNNENAPTIWPACDCGVAHVYRRAFGMSGSQWVWMADCKHPRKETHAPELVTADGPYVPPAGTDG